MKNRNRFKSKASIEIIDQPRNEFESHQKGFDFFMLEGLFGNQNVSRILIFLFVNGRCYGTQLHQALNVPLTPVQKALNRLEKGGIIMSDYQGKTRIYQFNPAFPLMIELEQLLKKAYTLLPVREKREYYILKRESERSNLTNSSQILHALWDKLKNVSQITFSAKPKSKENSGWNGKGRGEVIVTKEESHILIFTEKGTWVDQGGREVSFHNVFRWTLDLWNGVISLEHLRRGHDHPVFLVHLAPSGKRSLSSVDSHLCEGDTYFGQIHFDSYSLRLNWRVIGPKKNEELDYYYS